ncbi:conserved hypothetical protein [Hyphomonas neptunium ATCC 15444]|uniref:DUF2164 domain-containing protein n=2 Tax=Hyphomonas TaxID=85 RepID=Q0BWY6_HYPNA|nr:MULTISPECIES: DUF2164 domain-containing protein [Hyphomonas]ABI76895.1 conserved hypothetical protein [Hyphomonas neptunium ATCC 15444]KCZ91993.1 hypothetical protein HHI_12209 [Hyphomonas hirschiana VP5]
MKKLALTPERRQSLVDELRRMSARDFDMPLSEFQAGEVVDRMTALIGPAIYNEAVQDVRLHLQRRLDDLDGEVFIDET